MAKSALLTGFIALAFLMGTAHATFSGGDQNAVNQFQAGQWTPRHVKLVGTASCASSITDVVTVTASVAVGNTLVVRLTTRDGASTAMTASDSKGNSYTLDGLADNSKIDYAIFSARVTTELVSGDTITVAHAGNTKATFMRVDEFADIADANRVYSSTTSTGNGTSSSVSSSLPTGNALAIGGVGVKDAVTLSAPGGWTILNNGSVSCDRSDLSSAAGYLVSSGSGTAVFSTSWSAKKDYSTAIVVYRGSF